MYIVLSHHLFRQGLVAKSLPDEMPTAHWATRTFLEILIEIHLKALSVKHRPFCHASVC